MIGLQITQLISLFAKVPGLGPRSAKRAVLHLIKKRDTHMLPLIRAMQEVIETVQVCPLCRNLDTVVPCSICTDVRRSADSICVVADVADLWALERSASFKGKYFVLDGLLSAVDGITPEDLGLYLLIDRMKSEKIAELVLALPVTVEGQTTAHYIASLVKEALDFEVKIYVLAQGIPVGGELDYLDDGTISTALDAKKQI